MRAYLSDRSARKNPVWHGGAHALAEARAILAETEPFAVWPEAQEASVAYLARTYSAATLPGLALAESIQRALDEGVFDAR